MSTPENLSSSPAPTQSTQYLESFRATLEKRWQEFDSAVAVDAGMLANMRFDNEKYQSAKAAFDEGRSLLVSIQNDAELKIAMKGPGRFSSILKTLENYSSQLSQAEKEKGYNRVLAVTLADLTTLKSQVIQVVEDKNTDEAVQRVTDEPPPRIEGANNPLASAGNDLANTVRSAAPAIQDTVAKLGAAAVGTGLIDKKGWGEMVKEGFTTFKEWILELFDDDSLLGKMLGGMKEKIMLAFGKIGEGLGIKSAVAGTVEKSKDALKNGSYLMSANILTKVLMENSEKLPLMDVLGYPLADISLNEMRKIHKTKTYDTIYKNFDIKDKSQQQAIVKIAETLFDSPRVSRHIQDAYFRNVGGNKVENTVTVKQYLSQAGKVMKNFQYGASIIAGKTHDVLGLRIQDGELSGWSEFDPEGEKEQIDAMFSEDKTFNKKFLAYVLGPSGGQYKVGSKIERLKQLEKDTMQSGTFKTDEERGMFRAEIGKVFDFADNLTKTILDTPDLNMGLKSDFQRLFREKGFTFRGLTLAYIALNGQTDYINMTTIERAQMHSLVMGMCMANDAGATGALLGKYTSAFRTSESAIPKEVWGFMSGVVKWGTEKTASGVFSLVKGLAGFAKEDPVIASTIIGLNAPIFTAKTSVAGMVLF